MLKMKQNSSKSHRLFSGKEFEFYSKNHGKSLKALSKGVLRSDLCFKKGTTWIEGNQRRKEFQKVVTNQSLHEFANWVVADGNAVRFNGLRNEWRLRKQRQAVSSTFKNAGKAETNLMHTCFGEGKKNWILRRRVESWRR